MKALEERIRKDGKVLPGDILKVDNFLNHQIDSKLTEEIGEEFGRLFKDQNPTKVLTIEASGIAIAIETGRALGYLPVVYAKKTATSNMSKSTYKTTEHSYTHDVEYVVQVSKDYINEEDRVLIVDDFLANGEAMNALIELCHQAGATIVGCGIVIGKVYQPGEKRIRDLGYDVEILARVSSMSDDGQIEFE